MHMNILSPGQKVIYDGQKFKALKGKIGRVISRIANSHKLVVAFGEGEEEESFVLPPTVVFARQ